MGQSSKRIAGNGLTGVPGLLVVSSLLCTVAPSL